MEESPATNMEGCTVQLDPETGKFLTLYLYADVENTAEIRGKITNGEVRCCVLKANLIADPFQIVVAANKAVVSEKFGKLTTRSLFSEILFNLSLSKNISQSLTKFGIDDKERNILVARIHDSEDDEESARNVLDSVKGRRLPIESLKDFTDPALLKKTYKIDDNEMKVSNLLDSVASRICTKDFAAY